MDFTAFKDLAEGIQAIAIAVAVIIGGIWAVYRFWSLRELGRARIDLERLKKAMTERATINVSLSARPQISPDGKEYYIELAALVSNVGNRTEVFDWSEGGVYTAPVVGQHEGNVILGDWIETQPLSWSPVISSALSPSETTVFAFLIPIPKPGIYHIAFYVSGTPEEREELKREHTRVGKEIGLIRWGADTYINVLDAKGGGGQNTT